jgi:hypothetical protein
MRIFSDSLQKEQFNNRHQLPRRPDPRAAKNDNDSQYTLFANLSHLLVFIFVYRSECAPAKEANTLLFHLASAEV